MKAFSNISVNPVKAFTRRAVEFFAIVGAVLTVQYFVAGYAKSAMGLGPDKIAESFLSTFSAALTLLLSTWVAYRIAHAKQQQDNSARRRENVMAFYNSMSSPEFVVARREAKEIIERFTHQSSRSFMEFHKDLMAQDRARLSGLMLLFRKLQLGLDNCYFDLSAVKECFGDEIVIWHDGCLKEVFEDIQWPSVRALRSLYMSVNSIATPEELDLWRVEADQLKTDLTSKNIESRQISAIKL